MRRAGGKWEGCSIPTDYLMPELIFDFFNKPQFNCNKLMQVKMTDAFNKFIEQSLGEEFDYNSVWPWVERQLDLNISREFEISMTSCCQSYQVIRSKYLSNLIENWPDDWHKNERKFFLQILFCYCFSKKIHPLKLECEEWQYLSSIIFEKNPLFLKFQAYEHLKAQRKLQWGISDDLIIQECVSKCGEGNWNQISKLIFYQTNCSKFFTTKQIRERWNNHIRTGLKKGPWTNQEDIALLDYILHRDRRWSEITRVFQKTRTQHMIKNRYNFLLAKHNKHQLKKPQKILRLLDKIKQKQNSEKTRVSVTQNNTAGHKNKTEEQAENEARSETHGKPEEQQQKTSRIQKQSSNLGIKSHSTATNIQQQCQKNMNGACFLDPTSLLLLNQGNICANYNIFSQNHPLPVLWLPIPSCQLTYPLNCYNEALILNNQSFENNTGL